jgi:hypothetical protein
MILVISLCFLGALLVPLVWKLRKDFPAGLAYGVFLCVSMSTFLRVPLPGALPQLTVFRLVLIIAFLFWLRQPRTGRLRDLPFFKWFLFWGIANFFSLLLTTVEFLGSLKRYLDFVLELWGFYLILGSSIHNRPQALKLLYAAAWGLGLVGILAFVEKYTGFNPVLYILPPDEEIGLRDITATYQHRILLGTGMAMALPLVFGLLSQTQRFSKKACLWGVILLVAGACYFAQSRGPWLGIGVAGAVLMMLGSYRVRLAMCVVGLFAAIVLISRPGVYETIFNSAKVTADSDSFKGGTFQYRLELWKVAWSQVSQSGVRFLLGYGPGCGLEKEIEWDLSYRNKTTEISSWDNHYAYDLLQSGIIGLAARLLLYLAVARALFRSYRDAPAGDKDLLAGLLASTAVLIFMMTNVLIFSKQLNFLFWTIAVAGSALTMPETAEDAEDEPVSELETAGRPSDPVPDPVSPGIS